MKSACSFAVYGNSRSISANCLRTLNAFVLLMLCTALYSPVSAATYTGTNTGAIADGGAPVPTCGAPRDIQFLVSGFVGGFGSGSVSFTMAPQHTFVGDLQVTLIAPDLTSHLLFGRVGQNAGTGDFGDNANLDGTYTFNDLSTLNIWTVAASAASTNFDITNGSYRTQANGPSASDNPGPAFTSLNAAFASMNPANVNGTWILRFVDCASGDTGTVSAASLTINPTLAGDVVLGGRVLNSNGVGIKGAVVTISGGTLAAPQTVVTGTFGHYMFDGLDAGQSYVVSVSSRRYTFPTAAMFVTLENDISEMDFVSNQ